MYLNVCWCWCVCMNDERAIFHRTQITISLWWHFMILILLRFFFSCVLPFTVAVSRLLFRKKNQLQAYGYLVRVWNYYRFILPNKYIRIIDTKSIFTHENSILILKWKKKIYTINSHEHEEIKKNNKENEGLWKREWEREKEKNGHWVNRGQSNISNVRYRIEGIQNI